MLKQPDPKRNKVCQASIKYSIRYAFKFKNGRCDKIKATFVKITEKEYKNKSKK